MILDTSTRSARIVLGEAVTTTAPTVCAFWADQTSGSAGFQPGNTNTTTNGTTPVTIVAAPGVGVQRAVTEVRCYNADTVTHAVTLQLNDNGTIYRIETVSVEAGATYSYLPSQASSASAPITLPLSTTNGGLGANNGAATGVPVFAAGTATVTATTGTGSPVLATSPALTGTPTVPTASPGTNTTQAASTAFVAAAVTAGPAAAINYVDNSGFTVNQSGYTSGSVLAAGIYGFDRWKGGAAGATLTFTASPASTTVTITAGSLQQVIEGLALLSRTYTLSWAGTALGRMSNTSGGGSYAASPVQFTATAGTNAFIEFTGGTLGQVQLSLGTVAVPWQPLRPEIELANCQRFFKYFNTQLAAGVYASAAVAIFLVDIPYPVVMRAAPTVTFDTVTYNNSNTLAVNSVAQPDHVRLQVNSTVAGGNVSVSFNMKLDANL